jgi:hypothetical protein
MPRRNRGHAVSRPNLPLITLNHGAWQAELIDPRPDPNLLGARFVHGGWVLRLLRNGRDICGKVDLGWHPYDGFGLPETFESGLAWHLTGDGEEFMRPGAGRIRRQGGEAGEEHADTRLSTVLTWQIESGPDWAVFRTEDSIRLPQRNRITYQLERRISLQDDGLVSSTTFTLHANMQRYLPLAWYAHPFFAQKNVQGTGYELPAAARLMPAPKLFPGMRSMGTAVRGEDGLWRPEPPGARAVFAGLWGCREPSRVHLDGGGILEMSLDVPLDHIVLWAGEHGSSLETKIARTWVHGEQANWTVRYRWVD